MKFDKYIPIERLRPFIRYFVVSENESEQQYKVFPSPGLVMGFQYSGELSKIDHNAEAKLASAGVTGISDIYKVFKNSQNTGTVLVYFSETGFTHFSSHPANEFFNLSLSLKEIFEQGAVSRVEELLSKATTDLGRINIVEQFLLAQIKGIKMDALITEAVRLISESRGSIKIKALNERLFISQSPLEKRFRKVVGTTPKKFASIVRFNHVLKTLYTHNNLTSLSYESGFFDQAHFIKDFKQFTGDTPENFRRFL